MSVEEGAYILAIALGVALLPATLLGLGFAFIGVLGLSPFAVAAFYFRGAHHLYSRVAPGDRFLLAAIGFVLYFAIAGGLQLAATNAYTEALDQIRSPEREVQRAGVRRIERWAFLLEPSRIRDEYSKTSDLIVKARIENAYALLTGKEIERSWTPALRR